MITGIYLKRLIIFFCIGFCRRAFKTTDKIVSKCPFFICNLTIWVQYGHIFYCTFSTKCTSLNFSYICRNHNLADSHCLPECLFFYCSYRIRKINLLYFGIKKCTTANMSYSLWDVIGSSWFLTWKSQQFFSILTKKDTVFRRKCFVLFGNFNTL